jgi:hypothetical protein
MKKRHELRRRIAYRYNRLFRNANYITNIRPRNYKKSFDMRGVPITECVCHGDVWCVKVIWDLRGEMEMVFKEMECVYCGTIADIPSYHEIEKWGLMDDADL